MASKILRTVALVAVASVAAAGTAHAQAVERGNIGVSYSFLRFIENGSSDANMPTGWLVSLAQPIAGSRVSLVGEAAGNYKSAFGETLQLR